MYGPSVMMWSLSATRVWNSSDSDVQTWMPGGSSLLSWMSSSSGSKKGAHRHGWARVLRTVPVLGGWRRAHVERHPASWWADAEGELAMTRLFGGFGESFYRSYDAVIPPNPGANERVDIYNLYHLLNHANLFGGGYIDQSRACLRELARKMNS